MPRFEFTITVEYDNEITEGSKQVAVDLASEAAAESVETSGGGTVTANGVIEGGRAGAKADQGKGDKA